MNRGGSGVHRCRLACHSPPGTAAIKGVGFADVHLPLIAAVSGGSSNFRKICLTYICRFAELILRKILYCYFYKDLCISMKNETKLSMRSGTKLLKIYGDK